MIKAFISHSSAQKKFARDLVNLLGRDNCILDCYDFCHAQKTLGEIYSKIDSCTVFVFLISKASLTSSWVRKEINKAKQKLNARQLEQFCPYIIDKTVDIKDVPKWIAKDECYNLKYYSSPEMLRRDIEQKFRRLIWNENPSIKARETTLVGRNQDIDLFENILFSQRRKYLRCIVISGRNGVGKDAFARQCIMKMGRPVEFEPFRISIDVKENIENFILYLNLYCKKYNESSLMKKLSSSPKEKAETAVTLLNTIYDSQAIIFVDDNMACILPNREISEWLQDILINPRLNNQIGLVIKSFIKPNTYIESSLPSMACLNLMPLNKNDRKKLFYQYKNYYKDFDIDENDVDFFVNKLLQSPSQILSAVEACASKGVAFAKNDIDYLIQVGDNKIRPLIGKFISDQLSKELLVVMSKIDCISFDILNDIFEEQFYEIQKIISQLMVYGIVSAFGPSDTFIRLDHYFCDYIKRNKIKIPKDLEIHIEDVLEQRVASSNVTEDVSLYLYNVKQNIIKGHFDNNSFLIPSIVIKSLIDIYNDRNYELVLQICDKIQNDSQNYYTEIKREISYWKCLALCRMAKPNEHSDFWTEVNNIEGADNKFLKGFFYRNLGNYKRAESFYNEALEIYPSMQRAKREMVTVLLWQGNYEKAFQLAKDNYEFDSENTYHIHAYFRCIAKKAWLKNDDIQIMEELMQAVKNSYSDKKEELWTAMNLEYAAYAKREPVDKILIMISEAEKLYPDSLDIKRAANEYKLKQEIISKEKFEKELVRWFKNGFEV